MIFIFSLITLFLIFSNLEHLPDLLRKSISIDISFDSKFVLIIIIMIIIVYIDAIRRAD